MKMQKAILAFVIAFALFGVANADTITLPGASWDGNLANPENWPNDTIPTSGSGDVKLSGLVGDLTLSENLTIGGTYTFQVNGGSSVSAAFGEYSLGVPARIAIGDSSSNNTFDLASGSLNGSAGFFVGRSGSSNTLRVSGSGTSVSAANRFIVGYKGGSDASGNVLIVTNGASLATSGSSGSLEAGANGSGNKILLDGAGTINVSQNACVGRDAYGCNNRMVVRNVDTAIFTRGIIVGGGEGADGNSLLVTNVANLTSGQIVVGNYGASCKGEVYLASSESSTLPTFKVGSYASASNCYLLVDGGGNSRTISGGPFSNFTLGGCGNTIELRNMTMTYTSERTITDMSCTNSQFVIGNGASVISTKSPFAFSNCAPGFGLTVDGGLVSFVNEFKLLSDACRMDVFSGGEVNCQNLYCHAGDVVVTISNATVQASGDIYIPNNAFDGWATNNVIRFLGTSPRMTAYRFYQRSKGDVGIDSDDNKTGVVFDFVLPENGYDTIPLETERIIWLCGKYCKIKVDASAYRGDRRWMPLMRSNNNTITTKMSEAALCADFPSSPELTVEHRIVTVGDAKEFQIRVIRPKGLSIIIK